MNTNEIIRKLEDYKALQRLIEEAQTELEVMKNEIKDAMGNNDTLTIGSYKVSYKTVSSTRIDTTALKKALPDIAEKFSKTTTVKRFVVS